MNFSCPRGLITLPLAIWAVFTISRSGFAATPLPTNTGAVTLTITIPSDGTYTVWSRIMLATAYNNSFWLQIDNGENILVGGAAIDLNTWCWVDYRNGSAANKIQVPLTAGSHTIKLIGKDFGVKVDQVYLTTENDIPLGAGATPTVFPTLAATATIEPTLVPTQTAIALTSDQDLLVFPQPAKDLVHLEFKMYGNGTWTAFLYNLAGENVAAYKDETAFAGGTAVVQLDVRKISAGVYFMILEVKDQKNSRTIKKKIALIK